MRLNAKFLRFIPIHLALVLIFLGSIAPIAEAQKKVTSPQEFFGFQLGSDKKIARWDKIVDYYRLLENESSKLKVIDMGPSTMGNPFLLKIGQRGKGGHLPVHEPSRHRDRGHPDGV